MSGLPILSTHRCPPLSAGKFWGGGKRWLILDSFLRFLLELGGHSFSLDCLFCTRSDSVNVNQRGLAATRRQLGCRCPGATLKAQLCFYTNTFVSLWGEKTQRNAYENTGSRASFYGDDFLPGTFSGTSNWILFSLVLVDTIWSLYPRHW